MKSSTASMNQRHGTFAQRIDCKFASMPAPSSSNSAPARPEPARPFIAVLLTCLSAFSA